MDKCPSMILDQTISALLGHILEKYTRATADVPQQMYHSRCATADVPQQMYHSRCTTVDVPQ